MSRRAALSWVVLAAALLALLALIAVSPPRPIYDEGWFLNTLPLLSRHGLSLQFLREFPGAAGPIFTLVFAAVDSVFGLTFPWLRLVNVALLAGITVLIWRCLVMAQHRTPTPALTAATLIVLPTVGVSAGMALTEMPAAFLAVLSIALLAQSLTSRGVIAAACSILGGIALGAAVLGRQNYLLLLPCLALAVRWTDGKANLADIWRVLLVVGFAIKVCVPVFVIWGGLVPPRMVLATTGFAPMSIVRSAGYAGLIVLLLAPRIYAPLWHRPTWLAAITVATLPVALLLDERTLPLRSAMQTVFDEQALVFIATGASMALSFAALAFAACFARHLWRHGSNWLIRLSGAFALLGILSNAKITHQFSSRYVFIVLPFIVIAAAPAIRVTWMTWLRMTSAAGVSLAALASYYFAQ